MSMGQKIVKYISILLTEVWDTPLGKYAQFLGLILKHVKHLFKYAPYNILTDTHYLADLVVSF